MWTRKPEDGSRKREDKRQTNKQTNKQNKIKGASVDTSSVNC